MRKRNITIGLLAVASLMFITTGVTLAFFNYTKQGETENVLRTGSIKFHYDETSKMGNGIKIEDALPVDSNESEKTNNHYFAFNITGRSSSQDISYVVTARKSNDSSDIDSDIDLYLTDDNNQELFGGIHKYSDLVQYRKINNYTEKVIYTDTVEGNGVEVSKNFRLRMWIDEKTDFSDGSYNNKTFKITVNVYTDTNINDYAVVTRLAPGFYGLDGTQIYSWQEILDNKLLGVNDGMVTNAMNTSTLRELDGSIVIDDSVTIINSGVFAGFQKLVGVTIPNTVTEIRSSSFAGCTNLVSVVIPSSVNIIGTYAFPACPNLTNVVFENPVGWVAGSTKLKKGNLLNTTTAATFLTTTYSGSTWTRTDPVPVTGVSGNFAEMIINDAKDSNTYFDTEPNITMAYNNSASTDAIGLYVSRRTNTGEPTYYFRGNVTNNIVEFANHTWRIVRVNEDKTVRLILDDNSIMDLGATFTHEEGLMYYSEGVGINSAKYLVDNWYQTTIVDEDYSSVVATGKYFCEQAKVTPDDYHISQGEGDLHLYDEEGYIPTFECIDELGKHGLLNASAGLLTYEEALYAGSYFHVSNDNYLKKGFTWWTMSPGGVERTSNHVITWIVMYDGGILYDGNITYKQFVRPVINLKADTIAIKDDVTGHYVIN